MVRREAKQIAHLIATVLALLDPEVIVVGPLGHEAVVMGAIAAGVTVARSKVFQTRIGLEIKGLDAGR